MELLYLKKPTEEDWLLAKQAAFVTIHKDTEKYPTFEWKHKMLAACHSPIRVIKFAILIRDVPSWISVHLVRHIHAQPFVSTQRNDRCNRDENYDRRKAPQDTPVDMIWYVNAEELMTIAHKRLCMLASKETRLLIRDLMNMIERDFPEFKGLLNPLCTYRNGLCTEFSPCDYYMKHGHGFRPKNWVDQITTDDIYEWFKRNKPGVDIYSVLGEC